MQMSSTQRIIQLEAQILGLGSDLLHLRLGALNDRSRICELENDNKRLENALAAVSRLEQCSDASALEQALADKLTGIENVLVLTASKAEEQMALHRQLVEKLEWVSKVKPVSGPLAPVPPDIVQQVDPLKVAAYGYYEDMVRANGRYDILKAKILLVSVVLGL